VNVLLSEAQKLWWWKREREKERLLLKVTICRKGERLKRMRLVAGEEGGVPE